MSAVCAGRRRALMFTSLAIGAMVFAGFACAVGAMAAPAVKAARVTAVYSIGFNGMGIGEFTLTARVADQRYHLNADARISVLAGLIFEWHGTTSSSGRVISRGPLPAAYSFGYRTSDKGEQINVKFSDNVVREIAVNPPQKPSAARIPVTRQHMHNVIDPLSAVLLLSNVGEAKSGTDVCNRRLPIFDGKARYDLQLSYKRTKRVKTADGYRGPAQVCKVKYIPIAGHKPGDDESGYAARNESIEVWMIPISHSGLYVPYYIYIPTPVGAATLTAARFDVNMPGTGRRARVEAEVE
jgi:hypothetical protein